MKYTLKNNRHIFIDAGKFSNYLIGRIGVHPSSDPNKVPNGVTTTRDVVIVVTDSAVDEELLQQLVDEYKEGDVYPAD